MSTQDKPTFEQYADLISKVENEVGMGHGAWDHLAPEEIVHAVLKHAAPTQPEQPSGGDLRNVKLPEGWVPLTIEHEPGYPEDVAFGPKRMMDRLKKWLDRYFAMAGRARTAAQRGEGRGCVRVARRLPCSSGQPGCRCRLPAWKGDRRSSLRG